MKKKPTTTKKGAAARKVKRTTLDKSDPAVPSMPALKKLYGKGQQEPLSRGVHRGGPALKIDAAKKVRVLDMLKIGGTHGDIARIIGVTPKTLANLWVRDPAFYAECQQVAMDAKKFFLGRIRAHSYEHWQAAAWWLERRYRREWGRHYANKVYGPGAKFRATLDFGDGKEVSVSIPAAGTPDPGAAAEVTHGLERNHDEDED